jgi:hypothetical protein
MLKALLALLNAGKYGVDIEGLVNVLATLKSDVAALENKQLVSQQVGVVKVAGKTIKYGVFAQEI